MKRGFLPVIICVVMLIMFACVKKHNYPAVPSLGYVSFQQVNEKLCQLELSFTDGDGDIGLDDHQTYPPFDSTSKFKDNLFITVFQKVNGKEVPYYTDEQHIDTLKFNYRLKTIPLLSGQDYLKGKFVVDISDPFWLMKENLHSDTLILHCILYDRKLHASNIVITPDLKVQRY